MRQCNLPTGSVRLLLCRRKGRVETIREERDE